MKILIKNGTLWDGECFRKADVLTDDNKIVGISDEIQHSADFCFDATGKIVSHGLVDIHTHMLGISSNEFGIPSDMSCIPFGVTMAADAGSEHINRSVLESSLTKCCVFASVDISEDRAVFDHTKKLLDEYGNMAVGLKLYYDDTICPVSSVRPLEEAVDFARNNNLKVMVHCTNSPVKMSEIINVLGKGDILTHTYHGGKSNAMEDGFECIFKAKERGIVIDAGMAGGVHTDFEVLKQGIMSGAIPDTISTDITRWSAYMRGGIYGMTMCMSIMKYLGMNEADIFRAVTVNPACVLGREKEYGILKEGTNADIAVFEYGNNAFDMPDKWGNRISYEKGYRCVFTMVNGQILYRN